MKKIVFFILILLITACPVLASTNIIKKGSPIPEITLPKIETNSSQPYIISFLLLQSKSSQNIINYYKKLLSSLKNKITIYIVALDTEESALSKYNIPENKNIIFISDINHKYAKPFQLLLLPTTFFVDKNDCLINLYIDFLPENQKNLLKDIETVLEFELQCSNVKTNLSSNTVPRE
jgi:hypothetical protein